MFPLINKFSIVLYGVATIALFKLFQDSILLNLRLLNMFHLTLLELFITKTTIALLFALSLSQILNNSLTVHKISPGSINKKSIWFILPVLISYTTAYYLTPEEPFMQGFLRGLNTQEMAVKIIATMILVPAVEELLFREIFLSTLLNLLGDKIGYIFSGAIVSIVFASIHTQYSTQTQILMFIVSAVFCAARYYSKWLALPIALHSLCIAVGLASEYI
ncbi:CAAX amino terminal protease self- immunity [Serratia ficaria]|uniref:CPBP family intramembrane glutamic endopeptidase n=1 Tax=Serratia ficaria TaxID=61651 RepID=UPI0021838E5C|nr:CPBP family intramembrane glutamic endopeptidase [Serratia ficaria]CAI2536833.1 CAAX amino terminal protease self- immunity [Serratia ficaria]